MERKSLYNLLLPCIDVFWVGFKPTLNFCIARADVLPLDHRARFMLVFQRKYNVTLNKKTIGR